MSPESNCTRSYANTISIWIVRVSRLAIAVHGAHGPRTTTCGPGPQQGEHGPSELPASLVFRTLFFRWHHRTCCVALPRIACIALPLLGAQIHAARRTRDAALLARLIGRARVSCALVVHHQVTSNASNTFTCVRDALRTQHTRTTNSLHAEGLARAPRTCPTQHLRNIASRLALSV